MAWGAIQNIVHVFFEKPPPPEKRQDHPFPEWRRYVKLRRPSDCRHHRRGSIIRLETALAMHKDCGMDARGILLINDN